MFVYLNTDKNTKLLELKYINQRIDFNTCCTLDTQTISNLIALVRAHSQVITVDSKYKPGQDMVTTNCCHLY